LCDGFADVSDAEESANSGAVGLPAQLAAEESQRETVSINLDNFEGPLDLLLHLVRRHELDILDIPIGFVCARYLEYLEFMRALDLEVAGDYLVMAATLAYLKSRELVPSQPEDVESGESDEDGPDPKEQLIARLLEFQKYRAAARDLDQLPVAGRDVFGRGGDLELPPVDPGLAPITLFRLAEAYHRVLERARVHKSHEVVMETVSVAGRMEQLVLLLDEQASIEFDALFLARSWGSEGELRSMLVVTLMSLLELVRLGVIRVHQPHAAQTILIERAATSAEARQALAGYARESGQAAGAGVRDDVDADDPPRSEGTSFQLDDHDPDAVGATPPQIEAQREPSQPEQGRQAHEQVVDPESGEAVCGQTRPEKGPAEAGGERAVAPLEEGHVEEGHGSTGPVEQGDRDDD
jgi:segregation and condensation protein A